MNKKQRENQKKKLVNALHNSFVELIELESPEFALGILESMKMAYTLVVFKKIKGLK